MRLGLLALVPIATGCVVAPQPLAVPKGDQAALIVGSAALPHPMGALARHPWIAVRASGERDWERWEVMCCADGGPLGTVERSHVDPLSDHGAGGGDVRIHGVWSGRAAEPLVACVRSEAPAYPQRDRYRAWPGPNSNTFVDWVLRRCDIPVALPAPSIGKDHRGLGLGASPTPGGSGVQLETPLVGVRAGLFEGVELHVLGLAWGVDLWPPALIVPVGSGRIGFDDRPGLSVR